MHNIYTEFLIGSTSLKLSFSLSLSLSRSLSRALFFSSLVFSLQSLPFSFFLSSYSYVYYEWHSIYLYDYSEATIGPACSSSPKRSSRLRYTLTSITAALKKNWKPSYQLLRWTIPRNWRKKQNSTKKNHFLTLTLSRWESLSTKRSPFLSSCIFLYRSSDLQSECLWIGVFMCLELVAALDEFAVWCGPFCRRGRRWGSFDYGFISYVYFMGTYPFRFLLIIIALQKQVTNCVTNNFFNYKNTINNKLIIS